MGLSAPCPLPGSLHSPICSNLLLKLNSLQSTFVLAKLNSLQSTFGLAKFNSLQLTFVLAKLNPLQVIACHRVKATRPMSAMCSATNTSPQSPLVPFYFLLHPSPLVSESRSRYKNSSLSVCDQQAEVCRSRLAGSLCNRIYYGAETAGPFTLARLLGLASGRGHVAVKTAMEKEQCYTWLHHTHICIHTHTYGYAVLCGGATGRRRDGTAARRAAQLAAARQV